MLLFSINSIFSEEETSIWFKSTPSLKEILYDLYDELQILSVCSGIERRLKLVEESYERKNDDSKKKYFMKTYQSLALIKKFYERETWKRENPDSDGEYWIDI